MPFQRLNPSKSPKEAQPHHLPRVIGIPDERMGEVAMAYIVPKAGANLSPEKITAWCKENMANYKVPRRVEIIDAFPLNATGKVMKFVLRDRALGKA